MMLKASLKPCRDATVFTPTKIGVHACVSHQPLLA